jgi:hypothetical protein
VVTDPKYWHYLRKDKRRVTGWLQRVDAEIIGAIFDYQLQKNVTGSCVEIGVHQGKLFIALCLALRVDELALCIDIFDDQDLNLDGSGKGDLAALRANIEKFGIDSSRIRILKNSSEDVNPDDILSEVGPARFFSVDGGHWESIVKNDLRLSEKTLVKGGVIALDDYCRVEWPDVTAGYDIWRHTTESNIVPFAAGSNKLFLCHAEYSSAYRAILKTSFLRPYFTKSYKWKHTQLDCYRVELVQ